MSGETQDLRIERGPSFKQTVEQSLLLGQVTLAMLLELLRFFGIKLSSGGISPHPEVPR